MDLATIEFRLIAPADIEAVAALWYEGWHDAHDSLCPEALVRERTRRSFARRVAAFGDGTLLAADRDWPAAFAALCGSEIEQFFVARRARGSGLAAIVMDRAEDVLRGNGVTVAGVECHTGNFRAVRFYRSRAFRNTTQETRTVPLSDGTCVKVSMQRLAKPLFRG